MAEGMGFEPMKAFSHLNRLAGGRTRPLCDPSVRLRVVVGFNISIYQTLGGLAIAKIVIFGTIASYGLDLHRLGGYFGA